MGSVECPDNMAQKNAVADLRVLKEGWHREDGVYSSLERGSQVNVSFSCSRRGVCMWGGGGGG